MTEEESNHGEFVALLDLQEVETSIRRLEHRLEQLPEQSALDEVTTRMSRVTGERDSLRVDRDLVASEMRKLEGEIGQLQERSGADRQRMYGGEISNPKELQALRREIDHIGERVSMLEEELLERMERREEMESTIATLEQTAEDLAVEEERLTATRDEAAKEILAQLAELRVRRDEVREVISDGLLDAYEMAREKHGGVGVGEMSGGICSACRMELTPLEISELREGSPLGSCPQCQRLLVVTD